MKAARLMLHTTYWNNAKKIESKLKAEKPYERDSALMNDPRPPAQGCQK
jgi:hypothetical protein